MAHYALLDETNTVVEVITGVDTEGTDWEQYYGELHNLRCKRTSYNTYAGRHHLGGGPFRKNYAIVGGVYDPVRDAFYATKPFPSWVLDEDTCLWHAPTPRPDGDSAYFWDEATKTWQESPA